MGGLVRFQYSPPNLKMMKKTIRIGVLGGGTASAVNLISILYTILLPEFANKSINYNFDIKCIHDPKIPVQQVGESITPPVFFALMNSLDFSLLSDLEALDGTIRYGARYFWEEANGQTFDIPYTSPGIHVNSEKFSYKILEMFSKKHPEIFTEIRDTIKDVSQDKDKVSVTCLEDTYEFDFVIDCTGYPSNQQLDSGDYNSPEIETVNSVILYPDFTQYNEPYTSSYVHKNGWMFGVPLTHRKAFGYLYHNKVTSEAEAIEHFSEMKGIDAGKLRKLSWRHYYKKKAMDGRILYSGNKLYFFEPHMTLPLHFYNMICTDFITKIFHTQFNVQEVNLQVNKGFREGIGKIQDLVALNYAGKVNIDSPFWKETNPKAKQRLINSDTFQHFVKGTLNSGKMKGYFVHPPKIMGEYINGYGLDLKELRRPD